MNFKKWMLLLFALITVSSKAQVTLEKVKKDNDLRLSTLPYYNYGKGLGITTPDSLFQLNIRFRMQNRASYIDNEGETGGYDWQIRRLRLRFDGFVGNPKFLYAIQLSFAPGDTGPLVEGDNYNIIRDAVIMYRPNTHWNFSFGQTKLPGNRQRVNSSGALQLTDRSINNARFNIDRDFGFQIHNLNEYKDKFSYNVKAAASTGEGRNTTKGPDSGLALTGKIELLPLGTFTKDGTNFEGDLMREKKPKLLLSGAFQQNNHAQRTQGQLGDDLYEQRTLKSVLLDGMFKYKGFAAMTSYMSRTTTKNAITFNPDDLTQSNYVYVGSGFDYQLSYLTKSNYEIIARYSLQKVGKDIVMKTPDTKEYTIGLTKYLWEHAFKLQTEITYDQLNYGNGSEKGNWYFRFQIEMGI
ncbi:porin [Flavobacterium stagni]|uniref:Porin n=1 Tax=Flavobacterium stagni TaxID=2506421 RepID=A0A4Q1K995_9FLAO|nr:porin [Flavobacterium stagni]RXR23013.1 porin [Flavobacterium stagni]